MDGGIGEAEQAVVGVAGEEGEDAVLAARALGDEVLFDEGLVAVAGDGVEVEVEGGAAGEGGEGLGGVEPAGGAGGDAAGIDTGGVLGEGGALGDGIEAGEEGEALVESVGHDAEGAADAPELEGEQGEGGAVGGDAVGAGEAGLLDERGEVELDEGGQEEEEAAEGGAEGAGGEVAGVAGGEGAGEDLGGEDLGGGAAREAGQAGLVEDFGDGGDAGGGVLAIELLGDLGSGEVAGTESEDTQAELGAGVVGGGRGGEEGSVGVAQEVGAEVAEGAVGIAEAGGGLGEGAALDEAGAEGFVAAVSRGGGLEEAVGGISHWNMLSDTLIIKQSQDKFSKVREQTGRGWSKRHEVLNKQVVTEILGGQFRPMERNCTGRMTAEIVFKMSNNQFIT